MHPGDESFRSEDALDFRGGYTTPQSRYSVNKKGIFPKAEGGFLVSGMDGNAAGTVMLTALDSQNMRVGVAVDSNGSVVWVANRNRDLIVAVNLSMVESDLWGCASGRCQCPGGRRTACEGPNATVVLR